MHLSATGPILRRLRPYDSGSGKTHEKASSCGCGRRRCSARAPASRRPLSATHRRLPRRRSGGSHPSTSSDRPTTKPGGTGAPVASTALSVDAQNQAGRRRTARPATASAARPAACRSPASTRRRSREHADVAEKMIRKLRAGMMPPPGAQRPDAATDRGVRRHARNAGSTPRPRSTRIPGWRPFQRLNRAEYQRAVKRPARHRRRRHRLPAARHDQPRLRQRRRRAGRSRRR